MSKQKLLPACRNCSERALPDELYCAYHLKQQQRLRAEERDRL